MKVVLPGKSAAMRCAFFRAQAGNRIDVTVLRASLYRRTRPQIRLPPTRMNSAAGMRYHHELQWRCT